jgi:hypothetical protein
MIEPDVIGERKSSNHTPTIALGLAALLLLVVGGLSYRDSVRSNLEKEYAEKEARLMQRLGGPVPAAATAANTPVNPAGNVPARGTTVLYDAQGNPVYLTGAQPVAAAPSNPPVAQAGSPVGLQAEANLPAPEDPDILRLQQSLDQARQQGAATEQRFNQLAGSGDPLAAEAGAISAAGANAPAAGGNATITSELPDFLRVAVENPPGGNPEIEARLARVRSQVTSAPSLGKVTGYDKDWGIVTFNAGAGQGVRIDQRFAVRRGSEILGWVKVNEVLEDEAIATLVTKNADSETAVKPDVGDDLIDFELF